MWPRRSSLLPLLLAACVPRPDGLDPVDTQGRELRAEDLPASPTNRFADNRRAAVLGRRLFFDRRLSANGSLACADCHDPRTGFADERPVSIGVGGQRGARHALPVMAAAFQPSVLWDGRADALWQQPILALEDPREMDFTRAELARFIRDNEREAYEAIFGPLPSLTELRARARPGMASWNALSPTTRDGLTRIAANVGKAIEAYERQLLCTDTRFDQWLRGELALSRTEQRGAEAFMRSGCDACHTGGLFSDGLFHNLGLSLDDLGRSEGVAALEDSPMNGASVYSDDRAHGRAHLAQAELDRGLDGAFRTPTLRGVTQRRAFGHAGQQPTPEAFIRATYLRRPDGGFLGSLDPLFPELERDDVDDLVAFLGTLECPPTDPALLAP